MAAVVIIGSGCGLRFEARHRNQPCKTKLSLYKHLLSPLQSFKAIAYK